MRAFYDDAHLVEKAQGGDRGALEQLIALHRAKVHHVALTILRDPELADEVVGEVLGHLPTTILSFNGRARFATWIHQVTRNRAISEQRKQPKSLSVPLT
ncbi:MAG: hypothetical protein C4320_01505, partial [Armatimonadota bacterium]